MKDVDGRRTTQAYEHLRVAEAGREAKAFEATQMWRGGAGSRGGRHASRRYINPILDGALTSFLGFLCLAFARYQYIQLYYFQVYARGRCCVVLVGPLIRDFARGNPRTIGDHHRRRPLRRRVRVPRRPRHRRALLG